MCCIEFKFIYIMYWFVVRSKTKQEFKAEETFKRQGIDAYVPYVKKHDTKSNKLIKKPAISSYVFFSLSKFSYSVVNDNPFVGDVIKNHDGVVIVSNEEIQAMRKHLSSHYATSDFSQVAIGDTIELSHGIFSGKQGEVVVIEKNRIIINLKSIAMRLSIALN